MHSLFSFRTKGLNLLIAAGLFLSLLAGTAGAAAASSGDGGAVYTMTNSASGNAIQEYERAEDGSLTVGGTFSTGGLGSGTGLGSQGAIVIGGGRLFAVNAGSNEISVFDIQPGQLVLVDKAASGGSSPISLTYHEGLLYVLNAGAGGNITGFKVSRNGQLTPIKGSTQLLSNKGSGSAPSPEEIAFTPDGDHLIVSEKGSNLIDSYTVNDGRARSAVVNPSSGPAPYGFGFGDHNILVISEAAQSAASSYKVGDKGLKVISASVVDTQAAACWLVVTRSGNFAYAANAASGTISGYTVSGKGKLALLDANGITATIGAGTHPIDMGISRGDDFLYVLASGNNTINLFRLNANGSLTSLGTVSSPAGASGLAVK